MPQALQPGMRVTLAVGAEPRTQTGDDGADVLEAEVCPWSQSCVFARRARFGLTACRSKSETVSVVRYLHNICC